MAELSPREVKRFKLLLAVAGVVVVGIVLVVAVLLGNISSDEYDSETIQDEVRKESVKALDAEKKHEERDTIKIGIGGFITRNLDVIVTVTVLSVIANIFVKFSNLFGGGKRRGRF